MAPPVPSTVKLPRQGAASRPLKPRVRTAKPKSVAAKPQTRRNAAKVASLPRRTRPTRTTHRQRNATRRRSRRTRRVIYVRRYYPAQGQRLQNLHRFIYHDFDY